SIRWTAAVGGFANRQRCRTSSKAAASSLLPVTIRGEGPGRGMRGSADFGDYLPNNRKPPLGRLHYAVSVQERQVVSAALNTPL
ncbi:MAG: hypothetical protein E5V94_06145, partial [Mesorhizobium sp.]